MGVLWKIPGVFTHVICYCATQQGFHLLKDIHSWFLPSVHCWYLSLNLTHCWVYQGICYTFSHFCFLLESHWRCSSSAVSCSDSESLSLHLAISCFPFSTPMIQQKEFIKGVKCLLIIRAGKTKLAIFDHRGLSQQPLKSALPSQ